MRFDDLNAQLDCLYQTRDGFDCVYIFPWIYFDGEGAVFRFTVEKGHSCKIETDRNFSEWFGWVTDGWDRYSKEIELITRRFGTAWDAEKGALSITFRRNEMPIAEALARLGQTVLILKNFRYHIFFKDRWH